ncbi:unnamed protein product [Alternaria alternata]
MGRLSLDPEATQQLLTKYQNEHSLIAEGAALNHGISPLDFNSHVDDALPLEELLAPDPELYKMLQEMDRSKVKLWLLTNAYVNHSKRVIRILGIEDQFEGLTYCDYGVTPMLCKPSFEMFRKAMKEAGVNDVEACYFVDDSAENCRQAEKLGWTTVHLVEETAEPPAEYVCGHKVARLVELRELFPQFFI